MDLEAPVDAWYAWLGVALVTVSIAGVVLSFPSEPAPDANAAVNTIEEVSTSSFNASATYEHDADEVDIDPTGIALENDGGTARATIRFGQMTPVCGNKSMINVTLGEDPSEEFADPGDMKSRAEKARDCAADAGWRTARDRLHVRRVQWGDTSVTFVYI